MKNRFLIKINKEDVKNLFNEHLLNTSFHGLPNITRARYKLQRSFWIFFTLVSTFLCAILVQQSIFDYFAHEVVTNIRSYQENEILFPTVTICTYNMFTTDYAFEFLSNVTRLNNITNIFDESIAKTLNFTERNKVKSLILSLAKKEVNKKEFSDDNKKKLGYSLSEILTECYFNGFPCSGTEYFEWVFDFNYGNCFKHKTKKLSYTPGPLKGLYFVVLTGFSEKLKPLNELFGLRLSIANTTSPTLFNKRVNLLPGYLTEIGIKRKFRQQLPKPFSECDIENTSQDSFESELYKMILQSKLEYIQLDCYEICIEKLISDACNCTTSSIFVTFFGKKICDISNKCNEREYERIRNESLFVKVCAPSCPLECNKYDFELTILLSYLNSNRQFPKGLNMTLEDMKKSLTSSSIYFESFSYEMSRESPHVDLPSLFSNIGGSIGWFFIALFCNCN